jgi:hypothetical protein
MIMQATARTLLELRLQEAARLPLRQLRLLSLTPFRHSALEAPEEPSSALVPVRAKERGLLSALTDVVAGAVHK